MLWMNMMERGPRSIAWLRFSDDIDAFAEKGQELESHVERLDKTCTKISAEKTKLMTHSTSDPKVRLKLKDRRLEELPQS